MKTIIYFYHIGKTGGNFVKTNLIKVSKKLNIKFYDFYDQNKGINNKKIENNKHKLKNFIRNIPKMKDKYIILQHHHNYGGIDDIYQDIIDMKKKLNKEDKFYLFTIVREPISHISSLVNYAKNNLNNTNFTFDNLINNNRFNIQSSYILYGNNSNKSVDINLLKKYLSLFDKIYTIEEIKEIPKDLKRIFNKNIYWNSDEKNVSVKTEFMTEEQKKIFLENNKVDTWLYQVKLNNKPK
jgi:hypothetical protein